MKQEIKELSEKFIAKLPQNQKYYVLDDFGASGFPPFLSKRIYQITLNRLRKDVPFPDSIWAHTSSPEIRKKWTTFRVELEKSAHTPIELIKEVTEAAITDVLSQLTMPRSYIPEFVFGDEDSLRTIDIKELCDAIVVYRYFPAFIEKYIDRKKVDILTKEQFQKIISTLDAKLISGYGTLDWSALLQSLFILMGNQVPSQLLKTFFKDKELHEIASRFNRTKKIITQDEFVEVLSIPETHRDEPDDIEPIDVIEETPEVELAEEEPKATEGKKYEAKESDEVDETAEIPETQTEKADEKTDPKADKTEDVDDSTDEILPENPEEEDNETPLHSIHHLHEEAEEHDDLKTDTDIEKPEETATDEEDEHEEEPILEIFSKNSGRRQEIEEETEKNEEEVPMWKTFSRDDDENVAIPHEEKEGKEEKESFMRIKMFEPPVPENAAEDLKNRLADEKTNYIKELFSEDEPAYEYAIEHISKFRNWREAGKYLTNEIFRRNTIDMYSDTAVDFTDRLHKYFIERERG